MKQYRLLVRVSTYQTARIIITAESDHAAKLIAEAQFGPNSVIHYTQVNS